MKRMILINLFFAFAISISVQAQKKTKPYMFVKKEIGDARKTEFIEKKYALLKEKINVSDIFYPCFFNMIYDMQKKHKSNFVYLRVYYAVYPATDPYFPNTLTLIFAPVDANNNDIGSYYNMKPGTMERPNVITASQKDNWVNLFITAQESLLGTIDNIRDNEINGVLSETRSIRYYGKNIKELQGELDRDHFYEGGGSAKIEGMKAYFAAYKVDGNQDGNYRKRMHIEFEFTDKDGNPIYLDFDHADQFPDGNHGYEDPDKTDKGINNGQLCPANCP